MKRATEGEKPSEQGLTEVSGPNDWSGRAIRAVRESVRPAVGAAVGIGFALWSLRELARLDGRGATPPEQFASGRISQMPEGGAP